MKRRDDGTDACDCPAVSSSTKGHALTALQIGHGDDELGEQLIL